MRKIVADLFISPDGVVEAPETWTGPYFSEDVGQPPSRTAVAVTRPGGQHD